MNLLMVQRYGDYRLIPRNNAISSPTTCDNLTVSRHILIITLIPVAKDVTFFRL